MRYVLIVDDELAMVPAAAQFRRLFEPAGFEFSFAATDEQAIRMLSSEVSFSLCLLDMRFAGQSSLHGLDLLRRLSERFPTLPIVMMSSRRDPEVLIKAWDLGARSYLVKWSDNAMFAEDLKSKLVLHARYLPSLKLLGSSPPIMKLRELVAAVAKYDVTVLIEGETGTGKEIVAELLHEQSDRASHRLLKVNCGAITESLVESELFGHKRGAFTGAVGDKRGLVESADGGTLFLDEVGELSKKTQQTLLRFLDRREFVPVGGTTTQSADVRIIAATNRPLRVLVSSGEFREDLFHRLNQLSIATPPLRSLGNDILLLAEHFLELARDRHGKPIEGFSEDVLQIFLKYPWPGNTRELLNAVTRAYMLTSAGRIQVGSLPEELATTTTLKRLPIQAPLEGNANLDELLSRETWRIVRSLAEQEQARGTRGLRTRVAERLGVNPRNGVGRLLVRIQQACPDLRAEIKQVFG